MIAPLMRYIFFLNFHLLSTWNAEHKFPIGAWLLVSEREWLSIVNVQSLTMYNLHLDEERRIVLPYVVQERNMEG